MFMKIKEWFSGLVDALAPDHGRQEIERRRMERHAAVVRLRDEFAMAALPAIIQNRGVQSSVLAAEIAYEVADEMMSYSYANLYGINQIGLRFFTVYGPWGRPDMAYWNFADAIMNGKPIQIFNNGKLRRDFTYIDDIVEGIMRIALRGPKFDKGEPPHKIYNIGNNQPVELMQFVETLERIIGKRAIKQYLPMQAGDVFETCANIDRLQKDYGFKPSTSLETGLGNFVRWFNDWKEMRGES